MPLQAKKVLYSDVHYTETWKAMEELVKKGLTKSIGVSNFNKRQLEEILRYATIKPVNNQVKAIKNLQYSILLSSCLLHIGRMSSLFKSEKINALL